MKKGKCHAGCVNGKGFMIFLIKVHTFATYLGGIKMLTQVRYKSLVNFRNLLNSILFGTYLK